MSDSKALKYLLFKQADIEIFADCIQATYPEFDRAGFLATIYDDTWDKLELKERMAHIVQALSQTMPPDFALATDILIKATRQANLSESFLPIIPCDYVAEHGLKHWEISMDALEILTQLGTAEGAIRFFILDTPQKTMAKMLAWASHENEHVRRLASEGCRPRLPWNIALPDFKADPSPILPILNTLKNDPSEYVRRSVANNLNDIAKDNPEVVITTLQDWHQNPTPEIQWITQHGLRTLIKDGNLKALALLGYQPKPDIKIHDFRFDRTSLEMGEALEISFRVESTNDKPQPLMIDYVLHAVKANGQQSAKVWKLKKVELSGRATLEITKKHHFKPVTTRKYYGGTHRIELQINGAIYDGADFELII